VSKIMVFQRDLEVAIDALELRRRMLLETKRHVEAQGQPVTQDFIRRIRTNDAAIANLSMNLAQGKRATG
jgi:hypothetical protein